MSYDISTYPQTNPEAAPGHPGNTTPEQEDKVEQLRSELIEAGYTERLDHACLLRFLRARKFDVVKAKEMFINCEKWRTDFGVDEISMTFVYSEKPEITKFYPQYYHKIDIAGRPVYIEQLGKINLTEMHKITTAERMTQNLVYEYERFVSPRLPACSRKEGKLIETSCTILDLKGIGISSISSVYGYLKQASTIGQDYYPERMGTLVMINAPWGFASAFKLVKPLLDEVTVKKINILGSDYQKVLLELIPAENLPTQFGGTCECPGGCELSDQGPWKLAEYSGETTVATVTASAPAPVPGHAV
ncbi:Sec14 cytosolic factor [Neolecta irregularis DAH-3]|uniref:Sec14 cytosolic factor n=1 Tax=Neolecta irregularis (strain DAH-3) TaxID=1198029 RepID=A0A1U7LI53_NEOID|nr:Sec14 cytosolic factor [Neolecta irregularis DAH-3]|eukprot:OLL22335.1 Sec14 cytosolic factor [Neolecta irregularis DAH-3]